MKKISLLITAILITACHYAAASVPAKIPIILDTDIGTDIDDAFALALIINSPEFELLGVTTVSGDTAIRARIAAKMLWEAGGKWRKVPVVAGAVGPKQNINQAPWTDEFTGAQILRISAIEFMRNEIHLYPGLVTIIGIGELTNVAALLKTDPLAAKGIKRLAIMGGSIARGYEPGSQPEAEWNIKSDAAAARTVFRSGIPILMAPLDVTAMLKLDASARSRIFNRNTPVTNSLAALYRLWNQETPTLFDPMAVALVLDPNLCQTKNLAVEIDGQGNTRVIHANASNATVGLSTSPGRFFEFFLGRIAPN